MHPRRRAMHPNKYKVRNKTFRRHKAMAIVRWEPFRDMVATQERLGRLFGELSRGFTDENGGTRPWAPAVDIFENDQNLVVNVELPGVDSKAVEIRVED